ncbi:MAG: hypothetical protein H6670_00240 [Anaerolineaceae bacterium]|nr:hypothetical protein [Anaerolineaceae bacterium]
MTLIQDQLTVTYADAPDLDYAYNHFEPRVHNTLIVTLPGRGYLNSHPMLHFIRMMCSQHEHDVLAIDYRFQQEHSGFEYEDMPTLIIETVQAIRQAAADYEEVVVVAKSLGTMIVPALVGEIPKLRALMLTPIATSMADIGDTPALAIIGTDDAAYVPEKVHNSAIVTWQVYEGLDHGLQLKGNWAASLRVLGDILTQCEAFLFEEE